MIARTVFDTSTLVSAALRRRSVPYQALQVAIFSRTLCLSDEILSELEAVLALKKFARYVRPESCREFLALLGANCIQFTVPPEIRSAVRGACRDADDDHILALCLAIGADVLVSSDHDLLVLHPWNGIPILKPAQFLLESEK